MNRLILFLKKIYVLLLFVVIEIVAINVYADSTPYTRAKLLTVSGSMTAGVNKSISGVTGYFGLRRENAVLTERISELQNRLELLQENAGDADASGIGVDGLEAAAYEYSACAVVNNSVTRQENHIIIDKGGRDGIKPNMALITPEGTIAGYVLEAGKNFSVAISVLNINFRTGGKIKGKDYFGSVWWDGADQSFVTLSEIPKYAAIEKGDTIVTGYSSIFPPDIMIGTVESYELNTSSYYDVKVRLGTRMGGLRNLLVVNYADIQERLLLEEGLF